MPPDNPPGNLRRLIGNLRARRDKDRAGSMMLRDLARLADAVKGGRVRVRYLRDAEEAIEAARAAGMTFEE